MATAVSNSSPIPATSVSQKIKKTSDADAAHIRSSPFKRQAEKLRKFQKQIGKF